MTRPLVLLRPQPGNDASAGRARAKGIEVVQIPLFEVVAAQPAPLPVAPFEAVLLSSANGARFGGAALAAYADLPLYAVGEATAQAAREAGHVHVLTGGGDAASTVPMIAAAGHSLILHICGADSHAFDPLGLTVIRHVVYRAAERAAQDVAPLLSLPGPAVIAVHSPRAGRRLAALLEGEARARFHVAAISAAAAETCGTGWASMTVSALPDDTALLHCVETLCIRAG